MKIHYLVTSLETGGAEFAIPDIIKTLEDFGHEVSIIACEPRDMGAAVRLEEAGLSYKLLFNRRRAYLITLSAYLAHIFKDRPDIIWTSLSRANLIGQSAGLIAGIPVVSFKHSASVRRYTYLMRNMSRLWIGDSQTVVNYLRESMKIPDDKIMAWPLFQSNPDSPVAQMWDGKSVLQMGSVGRLHEVKNYAGLLEGLSFFFENHPEMKSRIRLTILGDGPEHEALRSKIAELDLNDVVSLPGFSEDVERFLAGLHVYIQTSRYEGMCLAVHEAMNAGLAVISTPVGEIRDSVKEGETGYMLNGDLKQALNTTLERIFAKPDELARYGKQARRYVLQKFSHAQYAHAAEMILNKLNTDFSGNSSSK